MFLKKFDHYKVLSKNNLALIKKNKEFNEWLINNKNFKTEILNMDDGLAIVKPI
jgi:predicted O-methyltransferase YrrM